ncbi:hypothetical protein B0E47_01665 [Rhodanobacter sp. B05]|nr:hypothetical protein B0E47_01665 [Rhodanobacter sp. B05]
MVDAVSPLHALIEALEHDAGLRQPQSLRQRLDALDRLDRLASTGSGLGHVPLLASICTGAAAIGIEREPEYVACARAGAHALQLSNVQFHCQDARAADLAPATLLYLYTPFVGAVLRDMLEILRRRGAGRSIRIAALGPCVAVLAAQDWLLAEGTPAPDRITLFRPRRC